VTLRVASTAERETAERRIVALGFVYPDALDIRSVLPRGNSRVLAQVPAHQSSGALVQPSPDPGPVDEPTAGSQESP
jgi:hypothetical protein